MSDGGVYGGDAADNRLELLLGQFDDADELPVLLLHEDSSLSAQRASMITCYLKLASHHSVVKSARFRCPTRLYRPSG
jgi:hypothetical protein